MHISPAHDPGQSVEDDLPERFSIVAGGGFHTLLGRLGLLSDDLLPSPAAATGLALLAWSIPALVVAGQSVLDPGYSGWDYFGDATVYARYLVAIYIMVLTERVADERIVLLTRYFRDAELLNVPDRARFALAVRLADRRSGSWRAELVVLIIALACSFVATRLTTEISADTWEGMSRANGETVLSWAGEVSAMTSNALFLFLVFRWLWRFLIWAALLWRASRLPLQLMPLHPDRCGGLGFLTLFPGIFSGLVLALGCVIAASFHKAVPVFTQADPTIWMAVAAWLVLVSVIFLGPLLFFVRPLYIAREAARLQYGRLAHKHHLMFHRKWISGNAHENEILGSADPSSVSDLNASVETALGMITIPLDRNALLLLLGSAAAPLLLVAALQMPLGDLMKLLFGVLV